MEILVIDAQGGGIGRQLIIGLKAIKPDIKITAVGTNTLATSAMLKAGADQGATGENAVVVCASRADIIIGPIGIVIADSMLGEVTAKMAHAVGSSRAKRILIPFQNCNTWIAGIDEVNTKKLMDSAINAIVSMIEQ
ncbi:MAG: DUF3842 family protein [Faecalicoccus sp.]|nr:DUF3842 family protein [Faecalicoccus sp.]